MLGTSDSRSVYVRPFPGNFPARGGVREHMHQLFRCIGEHPDVRLANNEDEANVIHVESSYSSHRRPDVYVCHGGFVPEPIPAVLNNLKRAKIIVSVARWIIDEYFSQYAHKTIVIPNGVRLDEWENLLPSGLEPGYILYAKEYPWYMEAFCWLASVMPDQRFVTTVWPENISVPKNVYIIGLQSRVFIRSILNDAACLMLPGPEVCPTMLLEAWACKTPVISKWDAGGEELIYGCLLKNVQTDREALTSGGVLYRDMDGLLKVTEWLLNSGNNAMAGERGYREVVVKYQWPYLFRQYVRAYEAAQFNEVAKFIASQGEGSQARAS